MEKKVSIDKIHHPEFIATYNILKNAQDMVGMWHFSTIVCNTILLVSSSAIAFFTGFRKNKHLRRETKAFHYLNS